jgi:hypothetical protein
MKQPDACIVRITDAEGNTPGTGFLISANGRIATCYHVVKAIARPYVAFPGSKPRPAQVIATDPTHDVAILQLEGGLPPGAEPARLGRSVDARHLEFWSLGYRQLEGLEGIPAEGKVLQAVSEAPGFPDVHHMPLVLDSQHIRIGMSGAPIYIPELDLVVGMITGYWDALAAKTGYADRDTALATPSEAIADLCPEIRLSVLPSRPLSEIPPSKLVLFADDYISADLGNPYRIQSDFLHWPECTLLVWVSVPENGEGLRNAPGWRYLLAHNTGQEPRTEGEQTWRFYNLFAIRYSSCHGRWVLVYSNSRAKQGFLAIDDSLSAGWHQFSVAWNRSRLVFRIVPREPGHEVSRLYERQCNEMYLKHWPEVVSRQMFLGAWMPANADEVPYKTSYCNTRLFQLWLFPRSLEPTHRLVTEHYELQLPTLTGTPRSGGAEDC